MDHFAYRNGVLHCEDVALDDAFARQVGTPAYVYSRATLLHHYRSLREAFAPLEAEVLYSVKASSSLAILALFVAEGAGFDVVSAGELYRVLRAGADPARVVFAGVGKTDDELHYGLEKGIRRFNVESEDELRRLDACARARGAVARVALRLNPDVDPHTHTYITTGKRENKFGLDLEAAARLWDARASLPGVDLSGVHVHIGSQIVETAPYLAALERVLGFIDARRARGDRVETLNLGGGFGIYYADRKARTAEEHAREIVPRLTGRGLSVELEPGRFIAGNAAVLLARVVSVKRSGERRFVIVDAGMNDLIRPSLYGSYHRVWPALAEGPPPLDGEGAASAAALPHADIVGPICESGDFLAKERPFPEVKGGDLVAVFSAGAYGMSMASNYNSRPRAAEVLVARAGYRVVRRRETWEDLIRPEVEALGWTEGDPAAAGGEEEVAPEEIDLEGGDGG